MQMTTEAPTISRLLLALIVAGAAAASACRRDETASLAPPAPVASQPPPPVVAPPAPASPPVAEDQPANEGKNEGTTDSTIVGKGRWTENRLYKFRLDRVAPCGVTPPHPGAASRPRIDRVSQFRGETTWVGALFRLEARDHLFASPRDLELRRGGLILNAAQFKEPPAGCAPLALPRDLRAGDTLRGYALFEVPKRFRTKTEDPIVFTYKPTRWGGARRVEVPIPECFDACAEPPVLATGKATGRSPPTPRRNF